mgnify:CR=1 FL=1
MIALYLTHPQVQIDPGLPVPDWGLSALGRARLAGLVTRPWLHHLRRIVSSVEAKAVETAHLVGAACGIGPETRPGLHENDRSTTGYLPPDAFESAADRFFAAPDDSHLGWETARAAQARIVAAVGAALAGHPAEAPVLFVGHGAVGTLLRQALAGQPISRGGDQPAGGGAIFAFTLPDRRVLGGWTRMEEWSWPA